MKSSVKVSGYKVWKGKNKSVYLKGYLTLENRIISHPKNIVEILEGLDLKHSMKLIGGSFSLIINDIDSTKIITDIIRTYPLFVFSSGITNEVVVTDDIRRLGRMSLVEKEISLFLSFKSLMGGSNCYDNVISVEAGETVTITNQKVIKTKYFQFIPDVNARKISPKDFVERFNSTLEHTFNRILNSVDTVNNWVVPLSGGHDSRILINCFKKANVENVICYSYGSKGNIQSKISKQIADAAGYEWHFIEYTEDKWAELHNNGLMEEYSSFSFQGISTPHLQDLLAVYELKKSGRIIGGDVFVPGHTLDFVSGGHLKEIDLKVKNKKNAVDRVLNRHGSSNMVQENAREIISDLYAIFSGQPAEFQEYINWRERQSKFIVNSCRAYEFFDHEFRLPFWDRDFVEFWLGVSRIDRLNRNLFLQSERNGILIDDFAGIPFEDEINNTSKKKNSKISIKSLLPSYLRNFLLRITGHKQQLAEGTNLIFSKKGAKIEDILEPIAEFPEDVRKKINPHLKRYPYQINYHWLSALFAVRNALNAQKNKH